MKRASITSLKEYGYNIEPMQDVTQEQFVYKVIGPQPVFYIKKTKTGKLLAFRGVDDATDVTIHGLWDFKEKNGDLVGKRTQQQTQGTKRKPIARAA